MVLTVICVTGSIGAGKSTLINFLHNMLVKSGKYDQVYSYLEPIEEWQPYLDQFYANKDGSGEDTQFASVSMQLVVIQTFNKVTMKLKEFAKEENKNIIAIIERSPIETIEVFIKPNHALLGNKTESLVDILSMYANASVWKDAKYVFVLTTLTDCLRQIKERNRESEKEINIDYLQKLAGGYTQIVVKNSCYFENKYKIDGEQYRNEVIKLINCIEQKH